MARTKQTKHISTAASAKRNARILQTVKSRIMQKKRLVVTDEPHMKKHRKWRPGTVAKREIRKLSRSTNLLFPKLSFSRLVHVPHTCVCP